LLFQSIHFILLAFYYDCSIFSLFGVLAFIQSLVNQATIGPIVFFVGLMINEEALNFMPRRHYSAYIIGLFPSVYDWVTNVADRSPLTIDGTYNTNTPGTSGWVGILAWKRGALLVSMVWVAMLVNAIDRQWRTASIWAIVGALFAVFGIIHVPEAGFDNFGSPTWEQCSVGADGLADCWEFAEQWMFFVAYIMLAATFVLLHLGSKYDSTMEEAIDDESRHGTFLLLFAPPARVTE
jgi:AGZA family xanthine/uracil permease-like MFS transporter